jgi:hypothetical protein
MGSGAERRRALSEAEGDQETAGGGERARRLGLDFAPDRSSTRLGALCHPLGEADDRLAAWVVPEQQRQQQSQQRQCRQQECDELGHRARILSRLKHP